MRILLAHNYYQQPGGEDEVFASEGALLEAHGHEVIRFTRHNDAVEQMGRLSAAAAAVWSRDSSRDLRELVRKTRPQVAHFHNTFPLISPAAYHAARAEGAAVVQTLHNFRLVCPNALLFRDGHVCEDCLGRSVPWPGVVHRCYRGSSAASAAVALMLAAHRALGTWRAAVDVHVALTEHSRRKFIEGGLPAERILVKPNFVHPDPRPGEGKGGYAVFVGRLAPEKGLGTLLEAWKKLGGRVPLKVVGDGPLAGCVRQAAAGGGIEWLGRRPIPEVHTLLGEAAFLVFPSEWYETFGRVVIEAFAKGTPVIASGLGAAAELVDPGRTGLHFRPGDADDLAARVEHLLADPEGLRRMRREARAEFEARYEAGRNYAIMRQVYERALARRAGGAGAGPLAADAAT